MQYKTAAALLIMLMPLTVANDGADHAAGDDFPVEPGVISADNPLYMAEVVYDNIRIGFGVVDRGKVMVERAAEADEMIRKNKTGRAEVALDSLTVLANDGDRDDAGLDQALGVLRDIQLRVGEDNIGLRNAIGAVEMARDRAPPAAGV